MPLTVCCDTRKLLGGSTARDANFYPVPDLSAAVDVYGEWVDAAGTDIPASPALRIA